MEKEQTTIGGTVPFLFKTDVICDYLFCNQFQRNIIKPINNIGLLPWHCNRSVGYWRLHIV